MARNAAAASKLTESGKGVTRDAATTVSSAKPPGTSTRSPSAMPSTPGPVSRTTPAASLPGMKGTSRFT